MKVKKIHETGDETCRCGSWLTHWKICRDLQEFPLHCAVKGCQQNPEVGAHIKKVNPPDPNIYIIPLCNEHDRDTEEPFDIDEEIQLVSANVKRTCEKQIRTFFRSY